MPLHEERCLHRSAILNWRFHIEARIERDIPNQSVSEEGRLLNRHVYVYSSVFLLVKHSDSKCLSGFQPHSSPFPCDEASAVKEPNWNWRHHMCDALRFMVEFVLSSALAAFPWRLCCIRDGELCLCCVAQQTVSLFLCCAARGWARAQELQRSRWNRGGPPAKCSHNVCVNPSCFIPLPRNIFRDVCVLAVISTRA